MSCNYLGLPDIVHHLLYGNITVTQELNVESFISAIVAIYAYH